MRCDRPRARSRLPRGGRAAGAWAAALLAVGAVLWGAAVVAAPLTLAHPRGSDRPLAVAAVVTYLVGSVVCHQRAERSFFVSGVPLPVCARCTGIYAGAALAALGFLGTAWGGRRRPRDLSRLRVVLIVAAAPTVATVVAEAAGAIDPGHAGRALAGIPLGAAVIWVAGRLGPAGVP